MAVPRRTVAALALALLAACTSQPATSATPTPATATPVQTSPPAATATAPAPESPSATTSAAAAPDAVVAALGATVSAGVSAAAMTAIDKERPVAVGDTVSTDAGGLGEFRFADGSLARLGKSTTIVMVELTPAGVQRTKTSLTVGDTWHSVQKLTGPDAAYEVRTPVGVAAVRGTRFAVSCTPKKKCTITVLEGTVVFTPTGGAAIPITRFQRLQVPGDKAPRTVTRDELEADAWISDNLTRDDGAKILAAAPNPAFSGKYRVTTKVLTTTGGPASQFDTTPHVWTVVAECPSGPCGVLATSDSGRTWPFTYASGQWLDVQTVKVQCRTNSGDQPIPGSFTHAQIRLPVHVDRVKGSVPTRLSGTYAAHWDRCNNVPGISNFEPAYDETVAFVLTRLG